VAPCSVLDSVTIATDPDAHTVTLTAIEGSSARDVACIDIAQLKATTVDLGELDAGSWTIIATGDAPQVTLDIG
jgi:ethanolamine utilization microcompartment shell protein EutS